MRAFEKCTAQLNVDCIPHYDRCFEKYFKLKKAGCKDENRLLQAKNNAMADYRASVDRVAVGIKSDNEFVRMIKHTTYLKERNQTYEVIRMFENAIDQNADELKKNPEEGFSWWPTKTQMVILITVPAAVGLGAGAFAYFCCTGIGAGIAILAGAGIAVGVGIVLGLGFAVYKLCEKNADQMMKIGEKLRQLPKPPHNANNNIAAFELKSKTAFSDAPSLKSGFEEIFFTSPYGSS